MNFKDAYYFPHDSNAKDDPKIIEMIEQHGLEAYGIYWVLIEILRDQKDFRAPLAILPGLSRRFNTTHDKMKSVVLNYGLFNIEGDEFFYSKSLNNRMQGINDRRQKLSEAAKKGNAIRWGKEVNETPQNISKVSNAYPFSATDSYLVEMFESLQSTKEEAEKFYNHYSGQGWVKSNGIPITDWRPVAREWIQRGLFTRSVIGKSTGDIMRGYL